MTVDLSSIEKKLKEDPAFKKQFLTDPKAALEAEGLVLSKDMARKLKESVDQVTGPNKAVAGSNLGANPLEVGIGISIGKSF